jgi:hypothetical protein
MFSTMKDTVLSFTEARGRPHTARHQDARIRSALLVAFGTPVRSVSYRNARLQNEICLEAAGRADQRLRAEPVLLHLAPKRDGADLQGVSDLAPVAAKTLQRALDHGAFLCLKVEAVVGRTQTSLL